MKIILVHLFTLFFPLFCFAQQEHMPYITDKVCVSYDDISIGRNINLTFLKPLANDWTLYAGIKYNLNSNNFRNDYNINTMYFKEFRATKLSERIGLKFGVEKTFYRPNRFLDVFGFYDLQFSQGSITNTLRYAIDSPIYYWETETHLKSIENSFGLGANVYLNPRLRLKFKTGVGLNYFWTKDPLYGGNLNLDVNWRLPLPPNRLISIGLEYCLAPKDKKEKLAPIPTLPKHFIILQYNNVHIGRNIAFTYHKEILSKTYFNIGIKYHINNKLNVNYKLINESYYKKQFRADGFTQHLGLLGGLTKYFNLPNTNINFFGFYDLQISKSNVKNLAYVFNYNTGIARANYINTEKFFDNNAVYRIYKSVVAIENYIGLGASLPIAARLNMRLQAGIGYNFYAGSGHYEHYEINYLRIQGAGIRYPNESFDAPNSEFSKMFSIGLAYNLSN